MFKMCKLLGLTCAGVGLAMAPASAMAQAHLNVPATQHVMLLAETDNGTCCQAGQCFRFVHFPTRLLPDGTTTAFTIPGDRVLVITDFEWNWQSTDNTFQDQQQLFRLIPAGTADDFAKSNALTDSNSFTGASVEATSGFVVAPGTSICGFFAFGNPPFLGTATLRGYLDRRH